MIKHLCMMLTNGGMKGESVYGNRIREMMSDERKRERMKWLNTFYFNVCGRECHRVPFVDNFLIDYTGRRMRERWKDEGKEDEEGRREWERRWREGSDIMEEEDVMEVAVLHLCIPDYQLKKKDGVIVSSEISITALYLT